MNIILTLSYFISIFINLLNIYKRVVVIYIMNKMSILRNKYAEIIISHENLKKKKDVIPDLIKKLQLEVSYKELTEEEQEDLVAIIETLSDNYIKFEKMMKKRKPKTKTNIQKLEYDFTKIENENDYTTTGKAVLVNKMTNMDHKKITDIYFHIKYKNDTAPPQRTEQWYAIRGKSVTASDCGTVLGQNKYEKQYNFILKKVFGSVFETNFACYHGKRFENAVTMMYEYVNKVNVCEFGLLSSDSVEILAASPDGICHPYYKGQPSQHAGRMVEIKCPLTREIKHFGPIKGTICPVYYYHQIQQQLQCCDLNECDFVQCKIHAYNSKADFILDTHEKYDYYSKNQNKLRGVLIQVLPNKYDVKNYQSRIVPDEDLWNYADFIYPPNLEMTLDEIDKWIENEKNKLEENSEFVFHRVYYWYCGEMLTTLIEREKDWVETNIPIITKIWNYVVFLREHEDIANEFKLMIENSKIKYNDKILKSLDAMIEKYNDNIKK
jgi:putative phage-type endonuclease